MTFLASIYRTLIAAVYSPNYVSRFKDCRFSNMFWHVYRVCLIGSALVVIAAAIAIIASFSSIVPSNAVAQYYPGNLEVSIVNGKVSTNVEEPFIIPMSEGSTASSSPVNLLVIDTHTDNPLSALNAYDTTVLLTEDKLLIKKEDQEIRIFELSKIDELRINREVVEEWFKTLRPMLYVLVIILVCIAPFIIAFFTTLYYLAILLLGALVTMVFAKVRKTSLTYRQAYILSGYLLTLPILADALLNALGVFETSLIMSLLFVAEVILNVRHSERSDLG